MENKFVSMVIYLHNEEKNIIPFLDTAVDAIGGLFKPLLLG